MKPPCADWKLWTGAEIEGTSELGSKTLFIRSLSDFNVVDQKQFAEQLAELSGCKRVWFCKEFRDWKFLENIASHFESVCIEALPNNYVNIPKRIRLKYRIYVKVIMPNLKPGDFICVGEPFMDEAFEIGKGATVKPEDYLKDKRIK
jgi:hypothetical protein